MEHRAKVSFSPRCGGEQHQIHEEVQVHQPLKRMNIFCASWAAFPGCIRIGVKLTHSCQKRRLDTEDEQVGSTFKPSARFNPTEPREWTVSVAVPTSVIAE